MCSCTFVCIQQIWDVLTKYLKMLKEELSQLCNLEKHGAVFKALDFRANIWVQHSPLLRCKLMKANVVCDIANHKSFKALKVKKYIHRALYLFNLFPLLIQRGAI